MPRPKPAIKVNHDLLGGLLLIAIGAYAYVHGQQYALGTLNRMGPGFLPAVLSITLCSIGAILAVASQFKPAEAPQIRLVSLLLVAASLTTFAMLLRPAGLFTAAFVSVVLASLADRQITWPGRLVLGLVVAGLASLIFIAGLGMNLPLWPL
jgi:hypothetical protein